MAEKDEKKLSKAQLLSRYYNEMKNKSGSATKQGLSKRLGELDPAEIKALLERLEMQEMGKPSDEDVSRAVESFAEKKYTGGKVGDKYYGGGPVYPRPTKGN